MVLRLTNRLTAAQKQMLEQLDYYGTFDLSVRQAAEIIDGLLEEERLRKRDYEQDYNPTDWIN